MLIDFHMEFITYVYVGWGNLGAGPFTTFVETSPEVLRLHAATEGGDHDVDDGDGGDNVHTYSRTMMVAMFMLRITMMMADICIIFYPYCVSLLTHMSKLKAIRFRFQCI